MCSDPYLAEIVLFAGNFAPRGWAFCNGQLLPINQNQALFSLMGTLYGGNGTTNFALPDLRGRIPVSAGSGPGLSPYIVGQQAGVESVSLTASQIPPHTHPATTTVTANASPGEGDSTSPGGRVWAKSGQGDPDYATYDDATAVPMAPGAVSATTTVGTAGGGGAHTNIQPVLALHYIIALQGIYPSPP